MGLFNFLKKKKDIKPIVEEKKILTIEEIEISLTKKKQEGKLKEKDIAKKINSLLTEVSSELEEKNERLKKVDLNKKEENQNIKDLVLENMKIYSSFTDELINSIKEIKEENLQQLINEINKKFINFERNSKFSFNRANFLVGRELVATKDSIKLFFSKLNEIINDDKQFLESLVKINLIEKKINEIKKEQEIYEEIKVEMRKISSKKLELENRQEILQNQILEIQQSEEYLEKNKRKENAQKDKREIEKELFRIKTSINWKKLAELFHVSKKKMETLKDYEQDFSKILTNEEDLIEILKEASFDTEEISFKLNNIRQKKKEIEESLAQKDDLDGLKFNLNSNELEIKEILIKEEKISKKVEEIEAKILKIKEIINEESKVLF